MIQASAKMALKSQLAWMESTNQTLSLRYIVLLPSISRSLAGKKSALYQTFLGGAAPNWKKSPIRYKGRGMG